MRATLTACLRDLSLAYGQIWHMRIARNSSWTKYNFSPCVFSSPRRHSATFGGIYFALYLSTVVAGDWSLVPSVQHLCHYSLRTKGEALANFDAEDSTVIDAPTRDAAIADVDSSMGAGGQRRSLSFSAVFFLLFLSFSLPACQLASL